MKHQLPGIPDSLDGIAGGRAHPTHGGGDVPEYLLQGELRFDSATRRRKS
jgi:hypothetical protein